MQKKLSRLLLLLFLSTKIYTMNPEFNQLTNRQNIPGYFAKPSSLSSLHSNYTLAKIGGIGTLSALIGGAGWATTLNQYGFEAQENPSFFYGSTLLVSISSGLLGSYLMHRRSSYGLYQQAKKTVKNFEDDEQLKKILRINDQDLEKEVGDYFAEENYPMNEFRRLLRKRHSDLRRSNKKLISLNANPEITPELYALIDRQSDANQRHLNQINTFLQQTDTPELKTALQEENNDLQINNNAQKNPAKKALFTFLKEVTIKVIFEVAGKWFSGSSSEENASV